MDYGVLTGATIRGEHASVGLFNWAGPDQVVELQIMWQPTEGGDMQSICLKMNGADLRRALRAANADKDPAAVCKREGHVWRLTHEDGRDGPARCGRCGLIDF